MAAICVELLHRVAKARRIAANQLRRVALVTPSLRMRERRFMQAARLDLEAATFETLANEFASGSDDPTPERAVVLPK